MAELSKLLEGILEKPGAEDKLKSIIGSLGSGGENEQGEALQSPSFDPELMVKMAKVMSAMNDAKDDSGARLLCDLKPYVSDSRRKRVDEAVQILKLIRVMDVFGNVQGRE